MAKPKGPPNIVVRAPNEKWAWIIIISWIIALGIVLIMLWGCSSTYQESPILQTEGQTEAFLKLKETHFSQAAEPDSSVKDSWVQSLARVSSTCYDAGIYEDLQRVFNFHECVVHAKWPSGYNSWISLDWLREIPEEDAHACLDYWRRMPLTEPRISPTPYKTITGNPPDPPCENWPEE